MHELIGDITLCILFAWLLGLAAHFFRQPLILAYLIAGFAIGPFGLGWVKSQESIAVISELGLIFMLFMIGLEIDLKKIVRAGPVILVAAGGQLVGGCLLGLAFFVAFGLGFGGGRFDALYLTVACALSSTVIIVKVLYEKRELDTLPGRITLGILVLQDIFAILFLAVQPSLADLQVSVLLLSIARVVALVATALALSRYVLPWLFHRIARMPELVMLGAYVAYEVHRQTGNYWAALALATLALAIVGLVTERTVFRFTLSAPLTGFIVSLGLILILQGGAVYIWTANPQYIQPPFQGSWDVGAFVVIIQTAFNIALVIALLVLFLGVLPLTKALLKQSSLVTPRDYELIPVGVGAPAFLALTSGKVDALNLFDSQHATIEVRLAAHRR